MIAKADPGARIQKLTGPLGRFPVPDQVRITGWSAHILEQLDNNRLIRPASEYSGPRGLKVVPITERP